MTFSERFELFRKYPKTPVFDHSNYRLFERIPAVPGTSNNRGLTVLTFSIAAYPVCLRLQNCQSKRNTVIYVPIITNEWLLGFVKPIISVIISQKILLIPLIMCLESVNFSNSGKWEWFQRKNNIWTNKQFVLCATKIEQQMVCFVSFFTSQSTVMVMLRCLHFI